MAFRLAVPAAACLAAPLLIGPALCILGLGAAGPVAGTSNVLLLAGCKGLIHNDAPGGLAAGFQSAHGVNCVFSMLQSAAMGGYGAPIVTTIVQVATAATAVVTGILQAPPEEEELQAQPGKEL